jgi:lysophospholipase L1-like esterase
VTVAAYYRGGNKQTASGAWTENAWGATFKIGTLNGIVQNIAIYNRKLTDAEVLSVSNIIESASFNVVNYPDYLIGPLGDSITYGAGSSDGYGYRKQLQADILARTNDAQRFSRISMVGDHADAADSTYFPRHSGVSGESIAQISARLDNVLTNYFYQSSVTDMRGRQIFLIHAGTNDVTAVGGGSYTATLASYTAMLDKIYAYNPNIEIYCALLIPRKDSGAAETNNVTFNGLLNTALTTYQATHPNVHIVDMHAAFVADATWATDYMSDGLHPNNAGYVVMGDTWNSAI